MSIINNGLLLAAEAAAAGGYEISRSLRFNSADSAYLSRTPASAGNRKTWTWAGWVKRSGLGSIQTLFSAGPLSSSGNPTGLVQFYFTSSDTVSLLAWRDSSNADGFTTSQVFRDPSAWLHLVLIVDTDDATSGDRFKFYVNGTRVTVFSSATYPSSGRTYSVNNTQAHELGRYVWGSNFYFSGYLADVHLVDGQALDPTSFGEFDTNGVWQPIAYAGSYGTNGFHLTFSDNSGTSSTTLGKDAAGSNNWTPNNFSVAAGSGNDSLVDVPQNGDQVDTGIGGEVRGNYAVFNALALNGNTLSNGNLDYLAGSANKPTLTTVGIPNTGKWYFEFTDVNSTSSFTAGVGTASVGVSSYLGADANGWGYQTHPTNAGYHNSGVFTTTGRINGAGSNTIVGVAIDRNAQKIWFSVNGTYVNSGVPASGTNAQYSNLPTSGELFPGASTGSGQNIVFNAGQRPFAYTAPSGFKALCTTNLPTPTIADPSTVMDVKLYTGNGSTQTISGLGFSPDLVWTKGRSYAYSNNVFDTVRTATKRLSTDVTLAEDTLSGVTAFNSDGFTLGSATGLNDNAVTYVAWTWDAGSSTVTNTQGSITSQVRANASAGFSIVTYTGNISANQTIGHGLGAAPSLIILKCRSNADGWPVYHASLGNTEYLRLESTAAKTSASPVFASTSPTSTVFTVGQTGLVNETGRTYVAYCFAPVAGYSAFGSYVGNGSADGPFVYTGFRPRWILTKASTSAGAADDWLIFDTQRDTYNVANKNLSANYSGQEQYYTGGFLRPTDVDILSNGFKLRNTRDASNLSGATYIYAAFAEHPFQFSRAR